MTDNIIQNPNIIETNISFEDFIQKYEGQAVEWHAGMVINKVSNNPQHNFIVFFLAQLLSFYLSHEKRGKILTDGVSMYLSDDVPARQPDIMVLFNDKLNQIKSTRVEGAADIVVEVVSPGSNIVDRGEKFDEYETAGVKEYWLIAPKHREAIVYGLNDEGYYERINSLTHLKSRLLDKFIIETTLLWEDELPTGHELVEIVDKMLK